MTDRPTASTINDAQLDDLYEQLAKAEQETAAAATAAAHLTSLVLDRAERAEARLSHLQATSEAAGTLLTRTTDERDQLRATLARVRKAIDSVKAAGQGHTPTSPHDKGVAAAVDWVTTRVLEAIDARLVHDQPRLAPRPRDCLFARACLASDPCATCDQPKEQP